MAASRTWLVLVHGGMYRRKWVPLLSGVLGRTQRLVQHLPVLTEPFWIPLSLQDSDGDKSDYNLVVDEVSPWSLARCPAQAAAVRFRTLVSQFGVLQAPAHCCWAAVASQDTCQPCSSALCQPRLIPLPLLWEGCASQGSALPATGLALLHNPLSAPLLQHPMWGG